MKISKTMKVAIGLALLAPLAMYADGADKIMDMASSELQNQFINSGTKKTIYTVGGLAGIGNYIRTNDYYAFLPFGVIIAACAVIFKYVTGTVV